MRIKLTQSARKRRRGKLHVIAAMTGLVARGGGRPEGADAERPDPRVAGRGIRGQLTALFRCLPHSAARGKHRLITLT